MNPCSIMQVRRYEAGELPEEQGAALRAHLETCGQCAQTRRELAAERERLQRDVPFEVFAAGVAEKLAHPPRQRWTVRRMVAPLALAASVALVAGLALRSTVPEETTRSKGGATIELFVQEKGSVHLLPLGEKVAPGAQLLPALRGTRGKRMVVTLIEPGESTVLYDGPVRDGPLPQAFEWTGTAAKLRVAVDGKTVAEVPLNR